MFILFLGATLGYISGDINKILMAIFGALLFLIALLVEITKYLIIDKGNNEK